jgi:hypothetical protein
MKIEELENSSQGNPYRMHTEMNLEQMLLNTVSKHLEGEGN